MARGYGGEGMITDSLSAAKYLDSAVADNIARSLKNSDTLSEISAFSQEELRAMINRLVEVYSGAFDLKVLGNSLKDVTVNYPVSKLAGRIDNEELRSIRSDRKNITEEFARIIQADTDIKTPVTPEAVKRLRRMLMDMDVLSSTKRTVYSHDRENGWEVSETGNEAYLIQPAVKYWHLEEAEKYIKESRYFAGLSEKDQDFLGDRLEEKIKGDMTEQIIAFEAGRDLPDDRYKVLKPVFRENGQSCGEYDLLIYDRKENSHYAFEIKHTESPFGEQIKHLSNPKFASYMTHLFGNRTCAAVLYRGDPFYVHDGSGHKIQYISISDFLISLAQTHDIKKTITGLSEHLEEHKFAADGHIEETDITGIMDEFIGSDYSDASEDTVFEVADPAEKSESQETGVSDNHVDNATEDHNAPYVTDSTDDRDDDL